MKKTYFKLLKLKKKLIDFIYEKFHKVISL